MISLTEEQKNEFKVLSQLLLDAETKQEIEYYTDKIHRLLDDAENLNQNKHTFFSQEQKEQYRHYKQQLLNANTNEEILFYEDKIMELIDKTENLPT